MHTHIKSEKTSIRSLEAFYLSCDLSFSFNSFVMSSDFARYLVRVIMVDSSTSVTYSDPNSSLSHLAAASDRCHRHM